jgi:hypothetical protein
MNIKINRLAYKCIRRGQKVSVGLHNFRLLCSTSAELTGKEDHDFAGYASIK